MRIIPAIDIIDGQCVRLTQGDYNTKKVYNANPLEVALQFEEMGIQYLHLVDLDGAKSNEIVNHEVLREIVASTSLKVDFGGGIKSDKAVEIAFENGAQQVTVGSIAAQDPELFLKWLQQYGSDRIILGADARNRMVASNGWLKASEKEVVQFIKDYEKQGVEYVICTDIARDGKLNGPATDLYQDILQQAKVKLIASGGISTMADLEEVRDTGCEGVIIGKAIYENRISLEELQTFINQNSSAC